MFESVNETRSAFEIEIEIGVTFVKYVDDYLC